MGKKYRLIIACDVEPVEETPPDPTPAPGTEPPLMADYKAHAMLYGKKHAEYLARETEPFDPQLDATYYDGTHVYQALRKYLPESEAEWCDLGLKHCLRVYRDGYARLGVSRLMGTNFYLGKVDGVHIGKRSAAGWYCWNCNETLCLGGNEKVHDSHGEWSEYCHRCGERPKPENLEVSSSGRELGFNNNKPQPKTGIASCSSFRWAVDSTSLFETLRAHQVPVIDEYGREYSSDDFRAVLSECPIQFFDSIGEDFS